jgi:hypothetical protein
MVDEQAIKKRKLEDSDEVETDSKKVGTRNMNAFRYDTEKLKRARSLLVGSFHQVKPSVLLRCPDRAG